MIQVIFFIALWYVCFTAVWIKTEELFKGMFKHHLYKDIAVLLMAASLYLVAYDSGWMNVVRGLKNG